MPESGTCTSIINLRYQDGSEGSPKNPAKYNNQDYMHLKDSYLRRGGLFVDNIFPPNNTSLGDMPSLPDWKEDQVEWLRPADILKKQGITDEPVFCTKGASRFDFGQGSLGNCWFLAAISALTFHKSLMVQVVPMDQSFKDYAGIFHFRFWRFGKWVDVVIDDHLPTLNGQLVSVRSKGGNEFWVPLMEKAYAKVCGSYADLSAGLPSEACKDFSGGVHMFYELQTVHSSGHDNDLWSSLSNATGCNSMVCCGTPPKGGRLVNSVGDTGIVDAHAYSVTAVTTVTLRGYPVKLVRVMNPWGATEWKGKWSDKSDLWSRVSPEDREKCFDRDDGEFWIEVEDFCRYFSMLFICCENPNFIDGDLTCQWQCMIYDGKWVAGRTAGGSLSNSTFATNPQYRIKVSIIDRTEKKDKNILLSLMQKPKQKSRKETRNYPIAVSVFKVPEGTPAGRLDSSFFNRTYPMKQTQMYTYNRDLIEQHSLEPGEYVIVPSTMKPYQSAEFVLSVFTKTEAKITPHDGHDDDDDHGHGHGHDHDHDHDHDKKEEDKLILPEVPGEKKDDLTTLFNKYADQRGQLSAFKLQSLLNDNFPHGTKFGFDLSTCRSLIATVDVDKNMRMTITEFKTLWAKIQEYKKAFNQADLNRNGSLSDYEVSMAIRAAGMDPDSLHVKLFIYRYSGFSNTTLESFITLMMKLDKSSSLFKDKSSGGVIHLTWDEWSSVSVYN